MRLALIGDIHLYTRLVAPWRLLNKRIVGMLSLWFNRQFHFDPRLLDALLMRVAQQHPDCLLCAGDVSTTSLATEFADLRAYLQRHVRGIPTLIVPGNHDRYTGAARRERAMEKCLGPLVPAPFPHFHLLTERWHLLALDAAEPHFTSAQGRLGPAQLQAAAQQIAGLSARDGLVVLCHYPAMYPPGVRDRIGHGLLDRADLRDLLARCPARVLYLHGHNHQPWSFTCAEPGLTHVTVVNAGAPTLRSRAHPCGQGFWNIDLPDDATQAIRLCRQVPYKDVADAGAVIRWRAEVVL